jgi:hypothetical protein
MIGMFEIQSTIRRCTRRRPGRLSGRSEPCSDIFVGSDRACSAIAVTLQRDSERFLLILSYLHLH